MSSRVDPRAGNDNAMGTSRGSALRTLTAAWARVPASTEAQGRGVRILITAGNLTEDAVPEWVVVVGMVGCRLGWGQLCGTRQGGPSQAPHINAA